MTDTAQRARALPTSPPAQLLMREMGITDENVERRSRAVGLGEEDLRRIAEIKDLVVGNAERYAEAFFDHLAGLDEAKRLFHNPDTLQRAKRLKQEHLVAMAQGLYGRSYIEQRVELASLYGRVGIEPRVFLGAFHNLLQHVGCDIMRRPGASGLEAFQRFVSLEKVAFLDIGLIVDVIIYERERVIRQQQQAIRELSTPVLQIRERMLLLPIIGVIDTHRARLLTDNLLRAIRQNRAKVVVMDVTGVATIDSKVANHLLQSITAARLMGASVIVTGLSAEVSQSLVAIGIDLDKLRTVGDLQGGLEEAEQTLGYRLIAPKADHVEQEAE